MYIWHRNWDHSRGQKLQEVQLVLHPWRPFYQPACHDKVPVTWLHITLVWHKDILSGNPPPTCAPCTTYLSIQHILVHCPRYTTKCKQSCVSDTINEILREGPYILTWVSFTFKPLALLPLGTFISLVTLPLIWTTVHKLMNIIWEMSYKSLIYSLQEACKGYAISWFLCPHHYWSQIITALITTNWTLPLSQPADNCPYWSPLEAALITGHS